MLPVTMSSVHQVHQVHQVHHVHHALPLLTTCHLAPCHQTDTPERQGKDKEPAGYLSPAIACVTRSTIHHALSGSTYRGEARSATTRMSAKVPEWRKHPKHGYDGKQARHGYEALQPRLSAARHMV